MAEVTVTVNLSDAEQVGEILRAAHDLVIQEGRYYERDGSGESKVLAVVPKAAIAALQAALDAMAPMTD